MAEAAFWRTGITKVEPNRVLLRGYDLAQLIGHYSFGDVVYLLLSGVLPEGKQGEMMEAILVALADHGLAAVSADTVRFVASAGVPLQASVAAGIIAMGDWHGGAIEEAARMFQEAAPQGKEVKTLASQVVRAYQQAGRRMSGYGHPYHSDDPRTLRLLELAQEWGLAGGHIALARAIERELERQAGRKLPLNVEGAVAAIISDLGLDWRLGKGFFVIARAAGLVAHAFEEATRERPLRRVSLAEIHYDGPEERRPP